MKFVLKPSLEHMALVKIVISLWNQNDVRTLISKLRYMDLLPRECGVSLHAGEWEKIEERVVEKVSQLSLAQLLKEKMFGVIKPIGIQILEWMQYYYKYDLWVENKRYQDLDLPAHLPAALCWTPQGTVDRKRTAEVLVGEEKLDVIKRYILACDYFLEDDIIRFWNRLPEGLKDYHWSNFPVVSFWSDNMKNEGAGHISYKDVFYSSVQNNNKAAAMYLLQKLNLQEREECLKEFAIYVKEADVLCFLLPEMKEEKLREVIKKNPYWVLHCFLQWPWQSFFIGVANCMWDFISKEMYDEILRYIICKVRNGYEDYDYRKLFDEFLQKSPSPLKDSFMDEFHYSWTLQTLFYIKDKESIRLILKAISFTEKERLIYNKEIISNLIRFIHENEWDFLEFFIRECLPSKTEMLKFKGALEKRLYSCTCFAIKKHKWNQIFCFSDDSICKYNKRSLEEGESSSSK